MNKFYELSMIMVAGVLLGFFAGGCDDMNKVQEEYASREEIVYLTKVDSIVAYPEVGKVKFVYWIGADPKIEQTVVYWNVRRDSLEKDFIRTGPGKQKDSIEITGIPPGVYQFEFRNKNKRGDYSLYSTAVGTILDKTEGGGEGDGEGNGD